MRWLLSVGSALAITVGAAIALSTPIQLSSVDHLERPIACGNALHADGAAAAAADDRNRRLHDSRADRFVTTDYQKQCAAMIVAKRRHAAIVSAAAAAVVLTAGGLGLAIRRVRQRRRGPASHSVAVHAATNGEGPRRV